jgi:cyanophycin synthetase
VSPEHPTLLAHRAQGHQVVCLREGHIVLAHGAQERPLLRVDSLKPAKAGQPEMVMAAVAAAWALDITPELIAAGLRTFESNPQKTPY